jgi:hypothetical protein
MLARAGGGDRAGETTVTEFDDEDEDDGDDKYDFSALRGLSREAFQLHGFGVMNSLKLGTPGFVPDEYLNAIAAETTIPAAELEAAGVWERREGGYFVVADGVVRAMIDFNEQQDRLRDECAARGEHPEDPEGQKSGWVTCAHCGIPLKRPDGGPVALPNGGPLGPDPRDD